MMIRILLLEIAISISDLEYELYEQRLQPLILNESFYEPLEVVILSDEMPEPISRAEYSLPRQDAITTRIDEYG